MIILYICNAKRNNIITDDQELEIRNDDEFKVKPKVKPLREIKTRRESRSYKSSKQANDRLLDLNKDINENNEDTFRVECCNKFQKNKHITDNERVEQSNDNVLEQYDFVNPNLDAPVNDLQQVLTMMALTSKPNTDDDIIVEADVNKAESSNHEEYYENLDRNADCNSTTSEGIDNIIRITPIRVQIDDKETYLMKKFVNKWKCYVQNRKKYVSERRQETLNQFFDKIAKKKMDITQSTEPENKAKLQARDYNTYQHR